MPELDFATSAGRRTWTRELLSPFDDAKWDRLVRALFAWQFKRVTPYRRLCEAHGVRPSSLRSWKEIPAMPQQVFKHERLYARGLSAPRLIYETSGTTTGEPGRQHLADVTIYNAVAVEGARRLGFFERQPELHFLAFAPRQAPQSSLSAMFHFWQQALRQKGARFWIEETARHRFVFGDWKRPLQAAIEARRPVALCGTAWAFLSVVEDPGTPRLKLPPGSWLLETGGFKGRTRDVAKAELYAKMAATFGVRDENIWNEYGMSELSSQAYARGTAGLHMTPPWARVLVVDPATGREVPAGRPGLVRWIDLANTDSVMALQTLDLAEPAASGFRLMGRLPRTEPRGCSLSIDDLVRRPAGFAP
jgi:hypothetical protein